MRRLLRRRGQGGFSLVEVLIVMLMLGIVTMSIFGLYQSTQRSTTTQDTVVELQQNLRVAMDQIARDVRMAGFMIPTADFPFEVANPATFTINTATASGRAARINANPVVNVPAATSLDLDLVVADASQAALFADDDFARIIRPPNQNDLFPGCTIQLRNAPAGTTLPLTISGCPASVDNQQVLPGDVIARVTNGSPNPNTLTYSIVVVDSPIAGEPDLKEARLVRQPNGTAPNQSMVVAAMPRREAADYPAWRVIDGLSMNLRYLRDDGTEADTVTGDDRENVKALRVTLTAQASVLNPQGGGWETKSRSLSSVIALRNR